MKHNGKEHSNTVKNMIIKAIFASMVVSGCSTAKINQSTVVSQPVSTETTPNVIVGINSPPPFWPPHEHDVFPGLFDQIEFDHDLNVYILDHDQHWNHISFDEDPTTVLNIQ